MHNSPHLRPAFELDEALLEFSRDLPKYAVNPTVKTEDELEHLLEIFKHQVFDKLQFWQYYVIDVDRWVSELSQLLLQPYAQSLREELYSPKGIKVNLLPMEKKAELLRLDAVYQATAGTRFGKSIRLPAAAEFMLASHCVVMPLNSPIDQRLLDGMLEEFRGLLNDINLGYYKEYDHDRVTIIENIRNRFKFERFAANGPQLGPINQV